MISVIICSRFPEISVQLKSNIEETIDVKHEIIVINNSDNTFSIFDAYNYGFSQSNYEICCFIHDDILFKTLGWGKITLQYFNENPDLGLLGVAGSRLKTLMPSAWWDCPTEFYHYNIVQSYTDGRVQKNELGFEKSNFVEVATIDGLFMVMRKSSMLRFDNTLNGFHGYDFNISMECHLNNKKIFVTQDILIHHQSQGELNYSWYNNMLILHKKYSAILPIMKDCREDFDYHLIERRNGFNFLKYFLQYRIDSRILYFLVRYMRYRPTILMNWLLLKNLFKGLIKR